MERMFVREVVSTAQVGRLECSAEVGGALCRKTMNVKWPANDAESVIAVYESMLGPFYQQRLRQGESE